MKRIIISFLRKLLRKPAILLVTIYAKHIYRKGVDAAERRHAIEGKRIYLAAKAFHADRLVTYSKAQFKVEKRAFGVAARLLTLITLKNRCYYHTADQWGKGGLSEREVNKRRKAFIKERLRYAGLI